jgi:hypothetical protein
LIYGFHHGFQGGAFFTQLLSFFRIVPGFGVSEQQFYFGEAFFLGIVVKGTP